MDIRVMIVSSQLHLKRHVENKHIRIRYACDECEYVATRADNLKVHVENKHDEKYPCSYCEYAATTASNLKIHAESKHEEVCYPCPKCKYAATTANNLKIHVESKHEGVRLGVSQEIDVLIVNMPLLQQVA